MQHCAGFISAESLYMFRTSSAHHQEYLKRSFVPNMVMWWPTCNYNTCTMGRRASFFKTPDDGRLTPETCRVTLQKLNLHSVTSSWCFIWISLDVFLCFSRVCIIFSSRLDFFNLLNVKGENLLSYLIIQRKTTLGRAPVDEGSALPRYLYLTTHNTHKRQKSMLLEGFEPATPESDLPHTQCFRPRDRRYRQYMGSEQIGVSRMSYKQANGRRFAKRVPKNRAMHLKFNYP